MAHKTQDVEDIVSCHAQFCRCYIMTLYHKAQTFLWMLPTVRAKLEPWDPGFLLQEQKEN